MVADRLMTERDHVKRIHVAVGVILDAKGQVLVARRADQQHLGGLWEFPGGKVEAGETVQQALSRELKEEIAIDVMQSRPLCRIEHNYPGKAVLLDVWIVDRFSGTPTGLENQPLRWLPTSQLEPAEFPQANRLIIRRLQLRDRLAIVNVPATRPASVQMPNDTLLRLRCQHKDQYQNYLSAAQQMLPALMNTSAGVIVDLSSAHINAAGRVHDDLLTVPGCRGLHAHGELLKTLAARPVPEHLLFGVSCHSREDLAMAAALDADYALLSPVKATSTHPDMSPLGWDAFADIIRESTVPVYALGGMQAPDLDIARANGARGIAGISLFSCDTMR